MPSAAHPKHRFGRVLLYILLGSVLFFGCMTILAGIIQQDPGDFELIDKIPPEMLSMNKCVSSGKLRDGWVEYREQGLKVKVVFPDAVESISGLWYAEKAQAEVNGEVIEGDPDVLFKKWDEHIIDKPNAKASPSFTVKIPLTEKDIHKTITINASMLAHYPYNLNDGINFGESYDTLEAQYHVFVVSPEDVSIKQQYDKWANDREIAMNRVPTLITGCVLSALSGGLIVLMIVRGKRKEKAFENNYHK
ncbi:MAG: hypothetical protein BWY11_01894 [Firmicutes bacterium ADurb.Bin182]|nr:MAG: hypothetical protein BWY11_01894 [Firmicutes bacterium ADurb.Bin182]